MQRSSMYENNSKRPIGRQNQKIYQVIILNSIRSSIGHSDKADFLTEYFLKYINENSYKDFFIFIYFIVER